MSRLRIVILLQLLVSTSFCQSALPNTQPPDQPEAFVRNLYQQVLAHHPYGNLNGKDRKIFAPYLSQKLTQHFALSKACANDWFRKNKGRMVKAPFAWAEAGPFSGGDERTAPNAFDIEKTEPEADGSSRVFVRLKWWETTDENADKYHNTPNRPFVWHVATIVVRENGRSVMDDVIYLKDKEYEHEYQLSEILSQGCRGPRWVGDLNQH